MVSLVEECINVADCDIEEEIRKELSERIHSIPWAKEVKSVSVE